MNYPDTRLTDTAEQRFGVTVDDPFRWLENDPRQDAEVADWIKAQNALSAAYLANLAGREVFQQRLTALFDHATATPPVEREGLYFFTRNSGLDNQAQLVIRDGSDGENRTLIDPNTWAEYGTVALAEWSPSGAGSLLAFAMQDGGSNWRTIRVMDTATGEMLDDMVEWARFTNIDWKRDSSGFYYSRFPEPEAGASFNAGIDAHAVYFHQLGTPQSEDRLVHAPLPGQPLLHTLDVTPDGRYLIVYTSALTGGAAITVTDLSAANPSPRSIVERYDASWILLGNVGSVLYLATQMDAPRGRVMALDLAEAEPELVELIPEKKDAVLRKGSAAVLGLVLIMLRGFALWPSSFPRSGWSFQV